MSDSQPMNRYWVVLGAVLIQLCLGAIYAWSVFTPHLTAEPYHLTATQTQMIFSVGLATFAVVMIVAGKMTERISRRALAALGGVVLGLGYVGAGFVGTSFIGLLFTIGLVGGAGIGMGYAVPIAVGVKWFPDKKGMLTGLAVAGFGFGALAWIKLGDSWGNLIDSIGLANTFICYGIAFAAIVLLGSFWMTDPPEGYRPRGWDPPAPSENPAAGAVDFESGKMLATWQFFALWIMFTACAMAGLMVIGCIKLFGIDALQSTGLSPEEASAKAGTAMGVFFALANGLGRIGWGVMSDYLGRKTSLVLMSAIQGAAMLAFYTMGFSVVLLYLGSAIIGFNFGGNFALFPAVTADYFGSKNIAANYAWVFTSYGVGGIVGPVLGGYFKSQAVGGDPTAWITPLVAAGLACLGASVVAIVLKPPKAPQQ